MPFVFFFSHSKNHHNPFPPLYTDGMLVGSNKNNENKMKIMTLENNDPWMKPLFLFSFLHFC